MSNNDKQDCLIANKLKNYSIISAYSERIKNPPIFHEAVLHATSHEKDLSEENLIENSILSQ